MIDRSLPKMITIIKETYMNNRISSGMGMGGIPKTDTIPETSEIFRFPSDNIPETTETTDFLKHLILPYSLKIKQNTCKNNSIQYVLKQSVNQNVYARLYATEFFGFLGYKVGMDTRVFQFSRVNFQLWVSHPYPYPSCSCMK
jgi:hypothetical protein